METPKILDIGINEFKMYERDVLIKWILFLMYLKLF